MTALQPARRAEVPTESAGAVARRTGTLVNTLMLITLLTQRLVIPLGESQLPVSLPLVVAVLGWALLNGTLQIDPVRWRLYVIAMATIVGCTLVSLIQGRSLSLLSLAFIVAIYVIGVVRPTVDPASYADPVHRVFIGTMTLASVVSILQLALQYLGVAYQDYLAAVVPEQFLQGGYRTGDPIAYGSNLHRTNAVLFLEPSFVGYFLAVAVLMALGRRAPMWQVCLLVAGAVPTLSGNALVVLLPGLVVLGLSRSHRRLLLRLTPALVVGLVLALATPLGALYLNRTTEVQASDTSSNLRLVAPYGYLLPVWGETIESTLVGVGAGAATEVIKDAGADVGAVITPAVPKLLVEYGLVGAVPLLLFLVFLLLGDIRRRPWAWGLFIGYFVLNAALLQITLAIGTILLMGLVPALPRERSQAPANAGATA